MRQRFTNLFKKDDQDRFAESALRRFWTTTRHQVLEARVVDLAQWVRGRTGAERR
jgi:hypothetical protein